MLHAPSTNWRSSTLWPGSLHLFVHDGMTTRSALPGSRDAGQDTIQEVSADTYDSAVIGAVGNLAGGRLSLLDLTATAKAKQHESAKPKVDSPVAYVGC